MTFWLWMTVFFSSLAESISIGQNSDLILERIGSGGRLVKKLSSLVDITNYKKVRKDSIKSGNLILLQGGDEIPFDGEVVKGVSYINETDTTGALELKLKSPNKANLAWALISLEEKKGLSFDFSAENLLLINSFQHFETTFNRWFHKCLTCT